MAATLQAEMPPDEGICNLVNVSLLEPCYGNRQPGTHPGIQPIRKADHGGGVQKRDAGEWECSGRVTVRALSHDTLIGGCR